MLFDVTGQKLFSPPLPPNWISFYSTSLHFGQAHFCGAKFRNINPLNTELNPICHLLALLEAHHILYVSRIRVKLSNFCKQLYNVVAEDISWGGGS
jgi:hypothetical protein